VQHDLEILVTGCKHIPKGRGMTMLVNGTLLSYWLPRSAISLMVALAAFVLKRLTGELLLCTYHIQAKVVKQAYLGLHWLHPVECAASAHSRPHLHQRWWHITDDTTLNPKSVDAPWSHH
jgi:hypothetical protein